MSFSLKYSIIFGTVISGVSVGILKLLTTEKERKIKMEQLRPVSKLERILFPIDVYKRQVVYTLNGEKLRSYDITTASGVQEKTFKWYIKTIFGMYMLKNINLND